MVAEEEGYKEEEKKLLNANGLVRWTQSLKKKIIIQRKRVVEVDSERNHESAAPFTVKSLLDAVEGEGLIKKNAQNVGGARARAKERTDTRRAERFLR